MAQNNDDIRPGMYFKNVTPHDSNRIQDGDSNDVLTRGILLGVAGDIAIKDQDDTTVVISGLAAGVIHPISTYLIMSTSTTASDICVFW